MGFLDRVLSDMVSDSTGFNVRPIVRRIGGRNILLAGGAALAGGLLAQKASQSSTDAAAEATPATGASMPPLPTARDSNLPSLPSTSPPELPSTPELPNLPDLPGEQDDDIPVALLPSVVLTMIGAAGADGHIEERERTVIEKHLASAELADSEKEALLKRLDDPPQASELAQAWPAAEDPSVLLDVAALVLRADGEIQDSERVWLETLAGALGVSAEAAQETLGAL